MTNPTLRRRVVGLLATLAVLAVIAGLPALLLVIGANPIPETLPTLDALMDSLLAPDDGTLILAVLEVVAWVAWAFMTVSLLLEISARVRGVRSPRVPGLGWPQTAAHGLVAAAALLFVAAPLITGTPPAAATPQGYVAQTAHAVHGGGSIAALGNTRSHARDAGRAAQTEVDARARSHTVRPGESLWSIASLHLGDGSRFEEIADLNRGLVGYKPGFLRPGWVLQVPAGTSDTIRYTVQPGDTLGTIARATLGDADRYMEIFNASTGQAQDDGGRLTNPDLIRVGWTLTIPGNANAPQHRDTQPGHRNNEPPDEPGNSSHADDDTREHGTGHPTDNRRQDTQPGRKEAQPRDETTRPKAEGTDRLDTSDEADDSVLSAPWMLAGLTGGGVLLSGALFVALQTRRRSQRRARRPGRMIAAPEPELAPIEKSISATGSAAAATVDFTDIALRRLAAAVGTQKGTMPPLAAVELGHGALTLHLSAPADLPAPWQGTTDHTHWHVSTDVETDALGPDPGYIEPPYPLLLTIGVSESGETWMLNCEEFACISLTGDQQVARDLSRHLAAQLAVNPWSTRVSVDCIGVAEEAATMDDRLTYHPTGPTAGQVVEDLVAAAATTIDRAAAHDTDVSTARTGYLDDDVWPARMLLLDAAAGEPPGLEQLRGLLDDHVGRAATSVLIAGDQPIARGMTLRVTSAGRLILEQAGLDLLAVGLSSEEARGCALLYAQRDVVDDIEIPVDQTATDGWESYVDRAGGLRPEHTRPRNLPAEASDEPVSSLLENDDEDYLLAGAAVVEDLQSVAPSVPSSIRVAVEGADPDLDRDVADWFSAVSQRPRLMLLGPVNARTYGKALAKRKPYFTELLAYLALRRRHGVTRDEICDAFAIAPGKARDYTNIVRDWLGTNPATGDPHLPHADRSPAALERGVNVYQVDDGLLIDTDLFRRLSVRARARGGSDGMHDLNTALHLVAGRPFAQLRAGGWTWLSEGERHDEYATVAVADVAFTLVTHCLAEGDLARARAAAETAMLAAPDEEVTRLCMVRITEAEGNTNEAQRILRDDICNRSDTDNAPTELSDRTDAIIRNHQWLAS